MAEKLALQMLRCSILIYTHMYFMPYGYTDDTTNNLAMTEKNALPGCSSHEEENTL